MPTEPASQHLNAEELEIQARWKRQAFFLPPQAGQDFTRLFEMLVAVRRELEERALTSEDRQKISEEYGYICKRANKLEAIMGHIAMMSFDVRQSKMNEHEFFLNVNRTLRDDITESAAPPAQEHSE